MDCLKPFENRVHHLGFSRQSTTRVFHDRVPPTKTKEKLRYDCFDPTNCNFKNRDSSLDTNIKCLNDKHHVNARDIRMSVPPTKIKAKLRYDCFNPNYNFKKRDSSLDTCIKHLNDKHHVNARDIKTNVEERDRYLPVSLICYIFH